MVGRRLKLDFGRVDRATFEAQRREYHRLLQETFFATRFAQVRDRFGVLWTLLHQRPR